jgi:hypothetical protein
VFELEVVDVTTGGRPPAGRVAKRTLLLGVVPAVADWVSYWFESAGSDLGDKIATAVAVAWVVLCCLQLLYASARVPGKRAMWDRLSNAMVRYRTPPSSAI